MKKRKINNYGFKWTLILGLVVLGAVSCNKKATESNAESGKELVPEKMGVAVGWMNSKPRSVKTVSALPKETAFKMSGDYQNNVAITLTPDGTITYFPAPTDITEQSRPVSLGDGWWLNRQGISPNSVFTRYTFEEYSKLKQVPTLQQLKDAIIPGARVTEMKVIVSD